MHIADRIKTNHTAKYNAMIKYFEDLRVLDYGNLDDIILLMTPGSDERNAALSDSKKFLSEADISAASATRQRQFFKIYLDEVVGDADYDTIEGAFTDKDLLTTETVKQKIVDKLAQKGIVITTDDL